MAHWLADAVAQGFVGVVIDQTPNEAYTVAGRNAGDDTPETLDPPTYDPNQFYTAQDDRPIGPTAGGGGTPPPEPEA